MEEVNIDTEFLNHFHYDQKGNYNWDIISVSRDNENKRSVFCGENKEDKNDWLYVKKFKLNFSNERNNDNIQILKEIYFLVFLRNQKYFVQLNDILLDNENDCKLLFLIFKGNNVSLNKLINYNVNDYLSNKDFIKWIIYQITCALYTLHKNNIIHNDIKPSNVLINEIGGISICDLGSAAYKEEDSYSYTKYYVSPEFLYDNYIKRDEKSDMWSLGIIMIELLLKKNGYFKIIGEDKSNEKQLKIILSKYGIKENIKKEEIKKIIEDNSNDYKFKFTNEETEKINDENAIDLLQNLLALNPKKRFSPEQVLESKYLSMFKGYDIFDNRTIDKPINYFELSELIDKIKFIEIITKLRSQLKV